MAGNVFNVPGAVTANTVGVAEGVWEKTTRGFSAGPVPPGPPVPAADPDQEKRRSRRIEAYERAHAAAEELRRQAEAKADEDARRMQEDYERQNGDPPIVQRLKNATFVEERYLAASLNLMPLLMASRAELDTDTVPTGLKLNDIFTKGLTRVCELVYGKTLTAGLAKLSREGNLRNFFETSNPQTTQCPNVIGDKQDTTPCWICDVALNDTKGWGPSECEHKCPVVLALLLSGLYDGRLARILIRTQRIQEYKNLLRYEYGWSHRRCNQIKNDDIFISHTVDARDKTVTFSTDQEKIKEDLALIVGDGYTNYTPSGEDLRNAIPKFNEDTWVPARVQGITKTLEPFLTKLTNGKFTAKQLMSHFVNGLLTRAIALAPNLVRYCVNNEGKPVLNDEMKRTLESYLQGKGGSRHRTQHRRSGRKQTFRKRMRGGADGEEVFSDYVIEIATLCRLPDLGTAIDAVYAGALDAIQGDAFFEVLADGVDRAIDRHRSDIVKDHATMLKSPRPANINALTLAIIETTEHNELKGGRGVWDDGYLRQTVAEEEVKDEKVWETVLGPPTTAAAAATGLANAGAPVTAAAAAYGVGDVSSGPSSESNETRAVAMAPDDGDDAMGAPAPMSDDAAAKAIAQKIISRLYDNPQSPPDPKTVENEIRTRSPQRLEKPVRDIVNTHAMKLFGAEVAKKLAGDSSDSDNEMSSANAEAATLSLQGAMNLEDEKGGSRLHFGPKPDWV